MDILEKRAADINNLDELRRMVAVMRSEISNLRQQIQGLKCQHKKDISSVVNGEMKLWFKESPVCRREQIPDGFRFKPIGKVVSSWFDSKNGTPRQPTICSESRGVIDLKELGVNFPKMANVEHSLENLNEFSHVWLLFVFHQNGDEFSKTKVAPPRLGGRRVGLFSTRSPHRPNMLGLTLAKLKGIEGTKLHVSGIDLIKGTPILDVKPYIPSYDMPQETKNDSSCHDVEIDVPGWVTDKGMVRPVFSQRGMDTLRSAMQESGSEKTESDLLRDSIARILSEDPRSSYRKSKCSDRLYFFSVNGYHVTCWFENGNEGEPTLAHILKVGRELR